MPLSNRLLSQPLSNRFEVFDNYETYQINDRFFSITHFVNIIWKFREKV